MSDSAAGGVEVKMPRKILQWLLQLCLNVDRVHPFVGGGKMTSWTNGLKSPGLAKR